jgi:hypothetical protein
MTTRSNTASVFRKIAALALAAALGACTTYATLIEPGNVDVQGKITVNAPQKWNKVSASGDNPAEVWVREGASLDSLQFRIGIEPGKNLVVLPRDASEQTREGARARANMTPEQLVDVISLVARSGAAGQFKATKIEPMQVLGQRGVRVEYSLIMQGQELEYRGIAYGASSDKDMSLMQFTAAKVHYFPTLSAQADAVMRSAKLKTR